MSAQMKGNARTPGNNIVSMIFIRSLFFVFGFVTWVNAVLIPYFKFIYERRIPKLFNMTRNTT